MTNPRLHTAISCGTTPQPIGSAHNISWLGAGIRVSNKVSHQILFPDEWQPNFSCAMSPSSAIKCKKIGYVSRLGEC
jgi:hypothetical protein